MAKDMYDHLRRRAYICLDGQVQHLHDVGYSTLADAMTSRPRDCKYCVFERDDGTALLVDMYELVFSGFGGRDPLQVLADGELHNNPSRYIRPIDGTTQTFPTTAAAILYAVHID